MKDIEYTLDLYDETGSKNYATWEGLSDLPRFEVGDQFDACFFDPYSENQDRYVVDDALHSLQVIDGKRKVTLWLRLRRETIFERGDRDEKRHNAR